MIQHTQVPIEPTEVESVAKYVSFNSIFYRG